MSSIKKSGREVAFVIDPDGSVLVTLPSRDCTLGSALGTREKSRRVARVGHSNSSWFVLFLVPSLVCCNQKGFTSRESAIAYEHKIILDNLSIVLSFYEHMLRSERG